MKLEEFNALDRSKAVEVIRDCCGSTRWSEAMADRRPFADRERLRAEARRVWQDLDEEAWREAFAAHPRIGGRVAVGSWSAKEQAGVGETAPEILRALREENRVYEEKFGHVFLICATGKSAGEMLESLRRRMANEPAREIRIAADEQERIMDLRLERWIES